MPSLSTRPLAVSIREKDTEPTKQSESKSKRENKSRLWKVPSWTSSATMDSSNGSAMSIKHTPVDDLFVRRFAQRDTTEPLVETSESESGPRGCLKYATQALSISKPSGSRRKSLSESVRWSTVEVHSHAVQLGDNPAVGTGAPICIKWEAFDSTIVDIESYESLRPERRTKQEMVLPRWVRDDMLKNAGYSRGRIQEATNEIMKIHEHRMKSARDGRMKEKLRKFLSIGGNRRGEVIKQRRLSLEAAMAE